MYNQKLMHDTMGKLTSDWLQEHIVMDGDTMIDRRTGKMLDPEVDFMYWKYKF